MFASLFFMVRTAAAWGAVCLLVMLFLFVGIVKHDPPAAFQILTFILVGIAMVVALSHIRRVRLLDQKPSLETLSNRHRRVIELPLNSNEAFELLEASIRDFPGMSLLESAADSL